MKQGLTASMGDVDLLGFEDEPTLKQHIEKCMSEKEHLEECLQMLSNYQPVDTIKDISPDEVQILILTLQDSLVVMGNYCQTIRDIKKRKEYALEKFKKRSGEDWRNGKFIYVISAIDAFMYEIETFQNNYRTVLERTCSFIASSNHSLHLYTKHPKVNLYDQPNYMPLLESQNPDDTEHIKQRSELWHTIRNDAKITGSTIHKAIGLESLTQEKEHFDKVVCGLSPQEIPTKVKEAMEYGTTNEENAVATVVAKILPVISPRSVFYEDGCYQVKENGRPFLVVSPDGCLHDKDTTEKLAGVEIKCPTKELHASVPFRYILQCLSEMEVHDVPYLLYVCWRPDFTRVFEIKRNHALFNTAYNIAKDIYASGKPKRPNKLHTDLEKLKSSIRDACKNSEFLGEYPSVVSGKEEKLNKRPDTYWTINDIKSLIEDVIQVISNGYQLQRCKASEAVVFLCSDLNRTWNKNAIRWSPIAWFPKGYGLKTETMRLIAEEVLNACYAAGLHVPATSFDGQWHNIAVRSFEGKPLTLLQLQKDLWKEVVKMQKSQILKELKAMNVKTEWHKCPTTGRLLCSNGGKILPKTGREGLGKEKRDTKDHREESDDQVPLTDTIPDEIQQTDIDDENERNDNINRCLLSYINIDQSDAIEMESTNASTEHWREEIESLVTEERETMLEHGDNTFEIGLLLN